MDFNNRKHIGKIFNVVVVEIPKTCYSVLKNLSPLLVLSIFMILIDTYNWYLKVIFWVAAFRVITKRWF